jgi:hypothetical protein
MSRFHMSDEAFVIAVVLIGLATLAVSLIARRREAPGMTDPDPVRLLRAYLFVLAVGGFGVLMAAFVVLTYPEPDLLGFAVTGAICGCLAVWSLLGIRRVRKASRT